MSDLVEVVSWTTFEEYDDIIFIFLKKGSFKEKGISLNPIVLIDAFLSYFDKDVNDADFIDATLKNGDINLYELGDFKAKDKNDVGIHVYGESGDEAIATYTFLEQTLKDLQALLRRKGKKGNFYDAVKMADIPKFLEQACQLTKLNLVKTPRRNDENHRISLILKR